MNIIQGIYECLRGPVDDDSPARAISHVYQAISVSEKPNPHLSQTFDQSIHTAATNAVLSLQDAEKAGDSLEAAIEDIVIKAGGWTERIATSILAMLENLLREGSPMRQAMKEAYDKACDAAVSLGEFIHDHPIFCTVIALGILVILAPAVIHALGFGALGPVEGKCSPCDNGRYS